MRHIWVTFDTDRQQPMLYVTQPPETKLGDDYGQRRILAVHRSVAFLYGSPNKSPFQMSLDLAVDHIIENDKLNYAAANLQFLGLADNICKWHRHAKHKKNKWQAKVLAAADLAHDGARRLFSIGTIDGKMPWHVTDGLTTSANGRVCPPFHRARAAAVKAEAPGGDCTADGPSHGGRGRQPHRCRCECQPQPQHRAWRHALRLDDQGALCRMVLCEEGGGEGSPLGGGVLAMAGPLLSAAHLCDQGAAIEHEARTWRSYAWTGATCCI
jgi:hypothetical protein